MEHYLVTGLLFSDSGKRKINQDNFCLPDGRINSDHSSSVKESFTIPLKKCNPSFAVFDGMGGESCGEEISKKAAENFAEITAGDGLVDSTKAAAGDFQNNIIPKPEVNKNIENEEALSKRIQAYTKKTNEDISRILLYAGEQSGGTTAAGLTFFQDTVSGYFIGDSRIYLIRYGKIMLLSHDETLGQEKVDGGELTLENAKKSHSWHVLTHFLGDNGSGIKLIEGFRILPGDRFIITSDGLSDLFTDEEIEEIFSKGNPEATVKNQEEYIKNNSEDNCTFIIIDVQKNSFTAWCEKILDKILEFFHKAA